jgi:hypothetical protein
MRIQIDPATDTFLLDHVVDGSPLLPTVMQLDLVARALLARDANRGAERPAGMRLRDIRVGPPLRFRPPGARPLDLRCTPDPAAPPGQSGVRCDLRSPGHGAPHLTAVAEAAPGPAPRGPAPRGWAADLRCGPDLVYPPFFHGPAFRVVGAFGRAGAGLAAVLAPGLPPLRWGDGPAVLRPRLLELLMQCCGLHELAATGRMMVPSAIQAAHWHPGALTARDDDEGGVIALITPQPGRQDHGRVFDGQVVAPDGAVLLTVTGYRTADLGVPANREHAGHLTRCLARCHAPAPHSRAGTATHEGASS